MNFESKAKFRFLGLDAQDLIRYFFGGNASLAIFILVLICVFLFKEAAYFFPAHNQQMQYYRKSGMEHFVFIEESYQKHKVNTQALSRAFQHDYQEPGKHLQQRLQGYLDSRIMFERETKLLRKALTNAKEQKKELEEADEKNPERLARIEAIITKITKEIRAQDDEAIKVVNPKTVKSLHDIPAEEIPKIRKAILSIEPGDREDAPYVAEVEALLEPINDKSWDDSAHINQSYLAFKRAARGMDRLWREAMNYAVGAGDAGEDEDYNPGNRDRAVTLDSVPGQIEGQVRVALMNFETPSIQKTTLGKAAVVAGSAEFFDEFARAFYLDRFGRQLALVLDEGASPYSLATKFELKRIKDFLSDFEMREPEFFATVKGEPNQLAAMIEGMPTEKFLSESVKATLHQLAQMDPTSEELIQALSDHANEFVPPYPYAERAKQVYEFTGRHREALDELREKGEPLLEALATTAQTEGARKELKQFRKGYAISLEQLEKTQTKLQNWRHDRKWRMHSTVGSFFFGKKWTNNSQIQDRYGVVPFFIGSLIISVIALVIAVPFSILAAIYVNQLARHRERSWLKPAIEFIQAIPSVVLGFLGIAVVGQALKDASNSNFLSWLPGFPMDERLTMLTAGILLGFMAIPIIFSLAEDALNNVPDAYRQGSLALGATNLQTAVRVVLPSALSGIIAAGLLGFGRVIGETMVVLLVAGNRIAVPDFTKGIGVITDPSHTMTGGVAQGLGEAAVGSVDYRALFMIGLLLFMISLTINFIAQVILKRYQAKA